MKGRTRKELRQQVQRLNAVRGLPMQAYSMNPEGRTVPNVGHLMLDEHSPGDGKTRYRLMRICEGGGESYVGTARGWGLSEMDAYLHGLVDAGNL